MSPTPIAPNTHLPSSAPRWDAAWNAAADDFRTAAADLAKPDASGAVELAQSGAAAIAAGAASPTFSFASPYRGEDAWEISGFAPKVASMVAAAAALPAGDPARREAAQALDALAVDITSVTSPAWSLADA